MITTERIIEFLDAQLAGTSLFVADIQVKPGNRIFIFIDSMGAVTIDDCARISHMFNSTFDRETDDYALEVSSAGLSSSFKVKQQYVKHTGKKVKIKTVDGIVIKGVLTGLENDIVCITEKGGTRKNPVTNTHRLPLGTITETKLDLSLLI